MEAISDFIDEHGKKVLVFIILILLIVFCARGFISVPDLDIQYVKITYHDASGDRTPFTLSDADREEFIKYINYENVDIWPDKFDPDEDDSYYIVEYNSTQVLIIFCEPRVYHGATVPYVKIESVVSIYSNFYKDGTLSQENIDKAMEIIARYQ